MYSVIKYKDKELKIVLWNIGQEKEFLLNYGNIENKSLEYRVKELSRSLLLSQNKDLDSFIKETHYIDLLYILFKCSLVINANSRKEYRVKCNRCQNIFNINLDLQEEENICFIPFYKETLSFEGIDIEIKSKDINDIPNHILDKLSISSYKTLKECLNNIEWDFYIKSKCYCNKCSKQNIVQYSFNEIFLNIIIETDLKYYYDSFFYLKKVLGISMEEFNSMKNFEIEVLITKVNELLEQENEK